MGYVDWATKLMHTALEEKENIVSIVEKIRHIDGKVAFYPCSKYCRQIIKRIISEDQILLEKILGCFDKSPEASSEPGVKVYQLKELDQFKKDISLMIIASSTYYARQKNDIVSEGTFTAPLLETSYFDYSMPDSYTPDFVIQEILRIMSTLQDNKSRMTYLTTWLSRIINDETLTELFESENPIPEPVGDVLPYGKYKIRGIMDEELKTELYADVYKMKHVSPSEGDCVLDVGAFRGETAIVFADMVGKKGKVFAFEPIKGSYDLMEKNVYENNLSEVIFPVNMGCSNMTLQTKAVSNDSGAPWNFISEDDGTVPVSLTTIDDYVFSNKIRKVDFIKMDVEGFENDAIAGAKEILKRDRPKLAIALYHKSSDMFTIPDQIRNIVPSYKLYVRCNMAGPYGLTLFCR